MTLAHKILSAAASSRAAYETINSVIEPGELGVLHEPIWQAISDYYARDERAALCDKAIIADRVAAQAQGEKKQSQLREICSTAIACDVSASNVADYVRDYRIDQTGMQLAAAIAGKRDRDEVETIARRYISYLDIPNTTDKEIEEISWGEVFRKRLDPAGKHKLSPKCLNERLGGGVFPGTNITIVARPETGKTGLALTIACGFVRRGLRGTYLTNEDSASVLMLRAACNLLDKTEMELALDPDASQREVIAKGAARLRVIDICPGTPAEIEAHIKATNPQFIVVDQIRNLRIKGSTGSTEVLDQAAQFVRAMGKKYGLITIGTTQAGDNAAGKAVLDLSHIDNSKTGIPGAADVIIMVGANDSLMAANQRMLSTPKNKVTARHESWRVVIDPFRSKYRSLAA